MTAKIRTVLLMSVFVVTSLLAQNPTNESQDLAQKPTNESQRASDIRAAVRQWSIADHKSRKQNEVPRTFIYEGTEISFISVQKQMPSEDKPSLYRVKGQANGQPIRIENEMKAPAMITSLEMVSYDKRIDYELFYSHESISHSQLEEQMSSVIQIGENSVAVIESKLMNSKNWPLSFPLPEYWTAQDHTYREALQLLSEEFYMEAGDEYDFAKAKTQYLCSDCSNQVVWEGAAAPATVRDLLTSILVTANQSRLKNGGESEFESWQVRPLMPLSDVADESAPIKWTLLAF